MGKYQGYPDYKETHLEWLQEIPNHWQIKRLKYLGEAIIGLTYSPDDVVDSEDEGTLVLRSSNVQNKALAFDDNVFVNKPIPEHLKTRKGDILICARNGSRALIGKNAQIDERAEGMTFGAFMSVFRSPYNDYLSKVFNSALFEYQSGTFLTATINQLTTANLNSFEVPLPPESERETIANFLDHETAKIDALIEKQQQLIKLLKEKRQAVISHAVTKGLNPQVPMKDSGVEWLGEVPEHWNVTKFGYISQVVRGGSPRPAGDPTLFDGDYSPWVTVAEITKDDEIYLSETETFLTKKGSEQCRVFTSGTLLLSNSGATLGVPKILSINANANDGVVGFENLTLNSEFAYFYLSTLTHDLRERIKQGSGQPNLNTDIVKNIFVPVPASPEETDTIVSYIKSMCDKFDALASKAKNAISLMQERRTALISAGVTGKIDVRNWQAPISQNQALEQTA
ncbi:TPA: restriction endonuclease subunit S [Vibrio parahaemolyticus]|uniref:restriction endonuclease subunit S n=1 Tax=Vibrio TaxID=662 RepID=UPI00193C8F0A|nr:restriction endonuclease subunit S [Vibrio parahaemolyticus]BDP34254.1 restriction modification system DNA specificity domain-containing protein [Vibrio alginolyticus]MBM4999846.1 restriction endonuclease subunit S [Vibrio parahaemolyticus]MCR9695998.1 restriction endonuclease subunit S [Vibrio parahaemolyticus]MCR9762552.1 restriction endonuclease subunit S [Vibrio parahaemolyticus]MDF5284285.1 restriction endonuclease subunit S [Vibrio parahaemolyticus]